MSQEPILITGVGKRLGLRLALNYLSRGQDVIGTYRSDRLSLAELRENGAELYQCSMTRLNSIDILLR